MVYGHDSSEFARSGRERGSDERCEAFCCGELRAFSGRPPRSLARQVRQAPPRYNPTGREREYGGWDWPCVTELRLRPKQTSTRVALKTRELRRTEFDSQGQLSRQSDRSRSASVESALLCDHCRYRKGDGRDRKLGSAWRRPARTQGDEHKGRAYDHGGEQPPSRLKHLWPVGTPGHRQIDHAETRENQRREHLMRTIDAQRVIADQLTRSIAARVCGSRRC